MADVLIWWWEKERLAAPQLLARSTTLIVKKNSLQSCLFAKQDNFYQLLIRLKHPGSHEPCRPGESDLSVMLSICMAWQNTHYCTKCTWLVDEVRYVKIWKTRKRNYFQLCCLGSWLVAKKSSQWLRCLVWSGSSVKTHPSKYYGSSDWKLEQSTIIVTGNG